jgi:hypothetical protein
MGKFILLYPLEESVIEIKIGVKKKIKKAFSRQ